MKKLKIVGGNFVLFYFLLVLITYFSFLFFFFNSCSRPLPPASGERPTSRLRTRPGAGQAACFSALHACARAVPSRSFFLPPRQRSWTNNRREGTGFLPIVGRVGGAEGGKGWVIWEEETEKAEGYKTNERASETQRRRDEGIN